MTESLTIAALRKERGWTLAEMAPRCLVPTKGRMSDIENGKANCTPEQALAIEGLSIRDGVARIDAATLNATVAMVRSGSVHAALDSAAEAAPSSGKGGDVTASVAA
jgi:transcriptional regulator with XRE-family HTH domain